MCFKNFAVFDPSGGRFSAAVLEFILDRHDNNILTLFFLAFTPRKERILLIIVAKVMYWDWDEYKKFFVYFMLIKLRWFIAMIEWQKINSLRGYDRSSMQSISADAILSRAHKNIDVPVRCQQEILFSIYLFTKFKDTNFRSWKSNKSPDYVNVVNGDIEHLVIFLQAGFLKRPLQVLILRVFFA